MKHFAVVSLAIASLSASAQAQVITRVSPEVASEGYLVTVEGTALGTTTELHFTGVVGGFVGTSTVVAPVESVSATRVTALVGSINGWIPPWLGPKGGSPFGLVRAVSTIAAVAPSEPFPFYFFQGTGGLLQNVGLGSTQFSGERAAISFDPGSEAVFPALGVPWTSIGSGAPFPGNTSFAFELEGAPFGSTPILLIGRPGLPLPFDDGVFAIDPFQIFAILPATSVSVEGDASVAVPIPASADGFGPLVAQWVFIEGFVATVRISSGMQMNYL